MPDSIISATGIYKTYDTGTVKVDALKGVDLSVERGEMVAICLLYTSDAADE